MRFDEVLPLEEAPSVLQEVLELVSIQRFHARGFIQGSDRGQQFHLEVDKPAQKWFIAFENGETQEFSDGTTMLGGGPLIHNTTFSEPVPMPAALAFPEKLMLWGQRANSARPMLAQNIGARSILITFEHQADASLRSTLVINRDLGLIERVIQFGLPQVVLVDVIPGEPFERHIPSVWPKPEVIYPEY
ncbi:hypothetical protein [Homoserinimonas sp. A520]